MNLFSIARHLLIESGSEQGPVQQVSRTVMGLLLSTPLAFTYLVSSAQGLAETPYLIPVVLAARLILFAPLLLCTAVRPEGRRTAKPGDETAPLRSYYQIYLGLSIAAVLELGRQIETLRSARFEGGSKGAFVKVAEALNADPAVSALGYDLIIAGLSLGLSSLATRM